MYMYIIILYHYLTSRIVSLEIAVVGYPKIERHGKAGRWFASGEKSFWSLWAGLFFFYEIIILFSS